MAKRMARMAARQLIRMLLLIFCASLATAGFPWESCGIAL